VGKGKEKKIYGIVYLIVVRPAGPATAFRMVEARKGVRGPPIIRVHLRRSQ